jgi:hypothetical protein
LNQAASSDDWSEQLFVFFYLVMSK